MVQCDSLNLSLNGGSAKLPTGPFWHVGQRWWWPKCGKDVQEEATSRAAMNLKETRRVFGFLQVPSSSFKLLRHSKMSLWQVRSNEPIAKSAGLTVMAGDQSNVSGRVEDFGEASWCRRSLGCEPRDLRGSPYVHVVSSSNFQHIPTPTVPTSNRS